MENIIPDSFDLIITETRTRFKVEDHASPIDRLFAMVAATALVQFYEDFVPWLKLKLGNDHTKFPPVWRFARVVRNAASHGQVHIKDQSFVPVSWANLTYGPAQDGRQVLGSDLWLGDIFLLMLEMDDALNLLGCPIEPQPSL